MITFIGSKEAVALFASDLLRTCCNDSLSITVIARAKLGDYFVRIVIDTELEDTLKQRVLEYSGLSLLTLIENTQDG